MSSPRKQTLVNVLLGEEVKDLNITFSTSSFKSAVDLLSTLEYFTKLNQTGLSRDYSPVFSAILKKNFGSMTLEDFMLLDNSEIKDIICDFAEECHRFSQDLCFSEVYRAKHILFKLMMDNM